MDKQTHLIFIMSLFIFILFIGNDWMKDTLIAMDDNSYSGIDLYSDIMKSAPKKIVEGLAPHSVQPYIQPVQSNQVIQKEPENDMEMDILTTWKNTNKFNYNTAILAGKTSFAQTTNNNKYYEKIKGF